MTSRCPRGHESTDPDYCSVCGIAMPATPASGGASSTGASATTTGGTTATVSGAPADGTVCPVCGTSRTDMTLRFCEVCRYDFQTGTPSPTSSDPPAMTTAVAPPPSAAPAHPPSAPGPDDPDDPFAAEFAALEAAAVAPGDNRSTAIPSTSSPATAPPAVPAVTATTAAPPLSPTTGTGGSTPPAFAPLTGPLWEVQISVDASLDTDPDPSLPVPTDEPDYFYPLTESETLIGRRDDRQGIRPQIPLRDPGASRRHAILRADDDGVSVMDLGSTNGTLVNGMELPPNSRRMLKNGDAITVGRWTRLIVRSEGT